MKNHNKRLLNVVILYANEEEVINYTKKLSLQSISKDVSLIIVINKIGNMDEEKFIRNIKEMEIDTYIYKANRNLGYLNGLIYGIDKFSKEEKLPNWIAMSNTDISFKEENFFESFLTYEYEPDIWIVGPSIYSLENKSYDNPQYKIRHTLNSINRRIFIFERPILSYLYFKLAKFKSKFKKTTKEDSQFVYSAHGCFFFIKKDFFDILKEKEYGALMYSEEAYLAELIRKNDKLCYYNNEIEVIHHESTVTSRLDIKKKTKYIVDSLRTIKKEFYL